MSFIPDPENEVDPYSEAITSALNVVSWGIEHEGRMSYQEFKILMIVKGVILIGDPALDK